MYISLISIIIILEYVTIIRRRRSEYCRIILQTKSIARVLFDNIFTEPEENNCFSIITQVIIQSNCIFFDFNCFFFKNIDKSRGGLLEIIASVL